MRPIKQGILAVFGLLLVLVTVFFFWLNSGRGPREAIDPYARGWTEEVDGVRVVHLAGTPYEMGYQRGYFARDKVRLNLELFEGLLEQAKEEMGLPRFITHLILDITYQLCSPFIPDRYKREMEGLADASGCDLKMIRRGHVLSVLTERGCSAFAVWGEATRDGSLYHGHNFDWITSAGLERTALVALYNPDGHHPFVSVGYAGLIGVISGANMKGITVSMIGAITSDKTLRGIPMEFVHRRLLEECASLNETTSLIRSLRHTVGFNYVVSDAEALDARAYETTANHVALFGPNDPAETVEYAVPIENAVFRSDEAMDPRVRSLQRCANAPGLPYGSNSYDHRYLGIASRLQEHYWSIDENIALDILKSTAMENANLHAMLINATRREMWVSWAEDGRNASQQRFIHLDLNRLFIPPDERIQETKAEGEIESESGAEEG